MLQARILTAWLATCLLNGCLYPEYIETDTFDRDKQVPSGGNTSTGGAADTSEAANTDAPLAGGVGAAGNAGANGGGASASENAGALAGTGARLAASGGVNGTAAPPTRGGSNNTRTTVTSPSGGVGTQPSASGRGGTDAAAAGSTVDLGIAGDIAGFSAVLPSCGDSKLDKTEKEACDDGNTADADGCSAQCLLEPGALTECSSSTQCATGSCLPPLDARSPGLTPTRHCLIRSGNGPCTSDAQCEGGVCLVGTCAASAK